MDILLARDALALTNAKTWTASWMNLRSGLMQAKFLGTLPSVWIVLWTRLRARESLMPN